MFGLGPATRIYVGLAAVDMRKGFEGLYGLVRDYLGEDPQSGHIFLFRNRGRTRLKDQGAGVGWERAMGVREAVGAGPVRVAGGGGGRTSGEAAAGGVDAFVERDGVIESGAARRLVRAINSRERSSGI